MKILAIRGENIASLERFSIDFREEPLASAGIFAIVGPTGSGKSTILDAMCLALYHQAPRMEGATTQEARLSGLFGEIGHGDIRNLIRRGSATGFAETEFVGVDGEAYRARWGYRAGKKAGSAPQEEISLLRLCDDQVLETRKVPCEKLVVELSGLSFEQFTRTVLLAQGRFAEFLRAKEGERADLLEKLTGTGVYSRISRAVHERKVREESARHDLEIGLDGLRILAPQEREARSKRLADLGEILPDLVGKAESAKELAAAARSWKAALEKSTALAGETESVTMAAKTARSAREAARSAVAEAALRRAELEETIGRALGLDARIEAQERAAQDCARREAAAVGRRSALESDLQTLDQSIARTKDALVEVEAFLESRARLSPVAKDWALCRSLLDLCAKARREKRDMDASQVEIQGRIAQREPRESELAAEIRLEEAALAGVDLDTLPRRRRELQARLDDLSRAARIAQLDAQDQARREREQGVLQTSERARKDAAQAQEDSVVARRVVDTLRTSVSESVQHLRETLEEGRECPVCGSLHHPRGADGTGALRDLLARHERELSQAEIEVGARRKEVAASEAALEQCDRDRERIERDRTAAGAVSEEIRSEMESLDDPDRVRWLDRESEAGRDLLARLEVAQERAQGLAALRQELSDLSRGLDADRIGLERSRVAALKADGVFQEHAATLDGIFGPDSPWRAKWESDPEDFLARLERQVPEYLGKIEARETARTALEQDRLRKEGIAPQLEEARRDSREAGILLAQAQEILSGLRKDRLGLLEGRAVPQVRERIAREETTLAQELDRCQKELDLCSQEFERHLTLHRASEREAAALQERIGRECPVLIADWASCLRDGVPDPARLETPLQRAQDASELALSDARDERARLEAELELDREATEAAASVRERIEAQSAVVARWAALSASVGSADGKAFKLVAQRFTLEALLEEANKELLQITPRYRLRILGESMHFGVVDADSFGEMRPVHTLSGGESFIVSLALALGLSRLAGGELRVESLFIDEGFGTLDPAALRSVMGALSSLHAQGRKVGVVTHVEEMKEQIPARIEVVRTGPGQSAVRIRG